ncbi:MAG: DUF2807 domain-containing protein [Hyphomonas sp.]
MTKTLTALATIAILLAPTALAETKTFPADDFNRIEVKGVMNVVYKTGPETKVVVETASGDFSDALILSEGDTLVVTREIVDKKRSWFSWGNSTNISRDGKTIKINGKKVPYYMVHVTGPDLEAVQVSQSSTFDSKTINAEDFSASASSSASIKLAGNSGATRLSASSSAEIHAKDLNAETLSLSASSSGEATGTVTGTGENSVDASSSGEATVYSKGAGTFNVDASSGGDANLSGACERIEISASSGADVDADELRCVTAKVNASSGADVDVYSNGMADGRASSGADIEFAGSPTQKESSKSSGGSVSFDN